MRRRRHARVPPDLTSLFDVLFIVIFAALIRAAAVQAAARAQPPPTPVVHLDPSSLRARALADLGAQLATRPAIVVRVSASGTITALEADGKVTPLDMPLIEHSSDPDVAIAYLGERSTELRVCRLVELHLGVDLASYLVIVAPDQRSLDLPHALYEGLHRDLERCMTDQHGIAALVDPIRDPSLPP